MGSNTPWATSRYVLLINGKEKELPLGIFDAKIGQGIRRSVQLIRWALLGTPWKDYAGEPFIQILYLCSI